MVQSGALFVSESPWLHGVRGEGDGKLDVADRIEFEALPRLRCDRLALGRAGCAPEFRILRVRAGPRQSAAWGRLTLNHDRRSHAYAGVGTGVGGPGAIILKTAVRRGHRRDDHRTFCGRLPLYHLMTSPDLGLT